MSIMKQVTMYNSLFPNETKGLEPLLTHIGQNKSKLYDRKTLPGHITGSSLVINDNQLLCIYHPYIKKWFQPGGHVDEGENSLKGAMREVVEETGLHVILHPWHDSNKIPFDIDIHYIPENKNKNEAGHYHYDFRYLFELDPSKGATQNELDFKWIPFEQLDDDLEKVVRKMREKEIYNGNIPKNL